MTTTTRPPTSRQEIVAKIGTDTKALKRAVRFGAIRGAIDCRDCEILADVDGVTYRIGHAECVVEGVNVATWGGNARYRHTPVEWVVTLFGAADGCADDLETTVPAAKWKTAAKAWLVAAIAK